MLRDHERYYDPGVPRVPLFPPKWKVHLLTVYCRSRWDVRRLLRSDLRFRRSLAIGQGTVSADALLVNWPNEFHGSIREHWLGFGAVQCHCPHSQRYSTSAALILFSAIVYGVVRLVRHGVRLPQWGKSKVSTTAEKKS